MLVITKFIPTTHKLTNMEHPQKIKCIWTHTGVCFVQAVAERGLC